MLSVTIWLYFAVFIGLNLLDWFTTVVVLMHFRRLPPVRVPMPFWKKTRFGRWCVRRGWVAPLKMGMCHWYDHEMNPVIRVGLKRLGMNTIAIMKIIMGLLIFRSLLIMVGNIPLVTWFALFSMLFGLICLAIFVVVNNTMVIMKCLRVPSAVVG